MSDTEPNPANEQPEIEPRLPENLLDRLSVLHDRQERRGLTELEKAIVADDLHQFNVAMEPFMQSFAELFADAIADIVAAGGELAEMIDAETDEDGREQTVYRDDEGTVLPAAGQNGEVYPCPRCSQYESVRFLSGEEYRYRCTECHLTYAKRDSENHYNE